jgi:BarA-like signal transduction histidine kinase
LILACSVKVNNHKDVFRPEYIIPQMLLQWVSEKDNEIAIVYSSSHIDLTNSNYDGRFINIVLPVRNYKEDYCNKLASVFKMTDVLTMRNHQLNQNKQIEKNDKTDYTNSHVNSIEMIKGKKSFYKDTSFLIFENALNKLPFGEIELK